MAIACDFFAKQLAELVVEQEVLKNGFIHLPNSLGSRLIHPHVIHPHEAAFRLYGENCIVGIDWSDLSEKDQTLICCTVRYHKNGTEVESVSQLSAQEQAALRRVLRELHPAAKHRVHFLFRSPQAQPITVTPARSSLHIKSQILGVPYSDEWIEATGHDDRETLSVLGLEDALRLTKLRYIEMFQYFGFSDPALESAISRLRQLKELVHRRPDWSAHLELIEQIECLLLLFSSDIESYNEAITTLEEKHKETAFKEWHLTTEICYRMRIFVESLGDQLRGHWTHRRSDPDRGHWEFGFGYQYTYRMFRDNMDVDQQKRDYPGPCFHWDAMERTYKDEMSTKKEGRALTHIVTQHKPHSLHKDILKEGHIRHIKQRYPDLCWRDEQSGAIL